jgi:hypothetical protein
LVCGRRLQLPSSWQQPAASSQPRPLVASDRDRPHRKELTRAVKP